MTEALRSILSTLPVKTETFTFKVPADSPVESERGQKQTREFSYPVCETDEQAHTVAAEKEWNFRDMVNDALKANARSSAYQSALIPHKAPTVSQDEIFERMVRDFQRMGVPEEMARTQVRAILDANRQ